MPQRFSGPSLRIASGLTAAVVAAAIGVAVMTTAPPAGAAAGCQASYRLDQWSGGFTAYVTVTAGATAVHGWSATWTYPAGQQVKASWGAQVAQSGTKVSATNLGWNADLAAGKSLEFGVQGTWSAANPAPADLVVTGSGCAVGAATVALSAGADPSAGTSLSPSLSPSLSADPTASALPSATALPSAGASASDVPISPASPNPPAGCAGTVLCDGFENLPAGTPTGAWKPVFTNCSGAGAATIDTTVAHSGSRSMKITGAAGYCNHVFVTPTASLAGIGAVWYGRFYVRHTTALPADHVAFMAMNDTHDGNKDLRMGGQNAALQWNRESDDATLPEQSPAGVAQSMVLPVGKWTCVEFMVNGTAGTMDTWLNGGLVAGLHDDGKPTTDLDGQWVGRGTWRPALSDFRLGWEAYGNGADTLWFDDVALGAHRVGC